MQQHMQSFQIAYHHHFLLFQLRGWLEFDNMLLYYGIGHKYSHLDASIDRQKRSVYRRPIALARNPCRYSSRQT